MIRTLAIIAGAGLALSLVGLAGAAAVGGHELRQGDWTNAWTWSDSEDRRSAAGPRRMAQRSLAWTGGDRLSVTIPTDVIFVQGSPASVAIEGRQDVIDSLTLVDGRLAFEEGVSWRGLDDSDLQVTVTAPDVRRFEVTGSGDLSIRGYDAETLAVSIEGSGDIDAAGRATTVEAVVSGSGDIDLEYLEAVDASASIAGSGKIELAATGVVSASVAGSGDVVLHRRPASLSSQVAGSGHVRVND